MDLTGEERTQMIVQTGRPRQLSFSGASEQTLAEMIAHGLKKATTQGIDIVMVLAVPLICFCVMSWSLSLPGAGEWLALIAVAVMLVLRNFFILREREDLRQGNSSLKENYEDIKCANEELRSNVNQLDLKIKQVEYVAVGLEEIRSAIETYSSHNNEDVRKLIKSLQSDITEQRRILLQTKAINQNTRNLTDMQMKHFFLTAFMTAQRQSRKHGLTRSTFPTFRAQLTTDLIEKLGGLLRFDCIDHNRDKIITIEDMNVWVERAITRLRIDECEAVDDLCYAAAPADSHITTQSVAHKHFASVRKDESSTRESTTIKIQPEFYNFKKRGEHDRMASIDSLAETTASSSGSPSTKS